MKKLLFILLVTTATIFSFNCNGGNDRDREYFEIGVNTLENGSHQLTLESTYTDDPTEVNVRMYFDDNDELNFPVIYWHDSLGGTPPNTGNANPFSTNPGIGSVTYYGYVKGEEITIHAEPVTIEQ
jgi:hypothetical protein